MIGSWSLHTVGVFHTVSAGATSCREQNHKNHARLQGFLAARLAVFGPAVRDTIAPHSKGGCAAWQELKVALPLSRAEAGE